MKIPVRFRSRRKGTPSATPGVASLEETVRLAPAPHAVFRKLGTEGGVLVHQRTTAYFRVNALGARIWELVTEEVSFGELVAHLRKELEDPPADLENDTGAFLRELINRDLVIERSLS